MPLMFGALLPKKPVYVRVSKNEFRVRNLDSARENTFVAQTPFTTTRLLIGQFLVAESLLKRALKETFERRVVAMQPQMLIQPLEMAEGGLSEVEERVLREVAFGAGASKVVVWVGRELSDAEVREKLYGR
ncbi:MAG: 1-pyrroline-5-carboxylate dehydrogenase [Betaproteobacteria bacterium]|nr:1-pyrroline-5-carboxylate dehydrogenase [Betaproteobacteria bacterium]